MGVLLCFPVYAISSSVWSAVLLLLLAKEETGAHLPAASRYAISWAMRAHFLRALRGFIM